LIADVLVSTNRDGMYSLQKRQSRKKQTQIQNEMILPREWTYWTRSAADCSSAICSNFFFSFVTHSC